MTPEQDREDLAHHERETAAHQSSRYGLLPVDEDELLGCLYIDPPERTGGAEVSWWVVDRLVGTDLEAVLDAFVPAWLAGAWPLRGPRFVGRDRSRADWLALPDLDSGQPTASGQ